jgi:PPOX class probable F420-dependent enzyme
MRLDLAECRRRAAAARVARLATVDEAHGVVDLVPCCFVLVDDLIVTAVDHKPKRHPNLKRLDNVRATPAVSLVFDEYDDDDWARLWWVRAYGRAEVIALGAAYRQALEEKYTQYASQPPPGPGLAVRVERWQGWSAT